jgi:lysophospholipase L1-like esterase
VVSVDNVSPILSAPPATDAVAPPATEQSAGTESTPRSSKAPRLAADLVRDDRAAIAYLIVFSAAAAVLLGSARNGAAQLVVQALLTAFVVTATLWVREQYVVSLRGHIWVLPGNFIVWMLMVAAALAVLWLLTEWNGLLLCALYLLWLGGSALVTRMRDTKTHGKNGRLEKLFIQAAKRHAYIGFVLTITGLVLVVAGLLLIGQHGSIRLFAVTAILLGAGSLMALPVGISLLSEAAISKLVGLEWRARIAALVVGGAVFGLLAWLAVAIAHTWMVLLVFAALLAIMFAIASSTHADVAIVMALVALLGVTPHQQTPSDLLTRQARDGGTLSTLVAIGDSYMSGEGASIYYNGTDEGGGNQCRRAPSAWAALASENGFEALSFLACSGARTGNVLYNPDANDPEIAIPSQPGARRFRDQLRAQHLIQVQQGDTANQLDQWRADKAARGLQATMVVVSLGGNDAGFSTIGAMCLAPGSCDEQKHLWIDSLEQVRSQLRLAYAEIAETFPGVPVVTVGYPDPISLEHTECQQVWLTTAERRFIHEFLTGNGNQDGLNDIVRETADEFGFYYVNAIETALSDVHLQLCDPLNDGRPGLNFVGLRSVRGAAEQRFNPANWIHSSLHPNERGHRALLRAFQAWRNQRTEPLLARKPIPPASAIRLQAAEQTWSQDAPKAAEKAVRNAGPCELFETSANGCRTQGSDWALGQVRNMLLFGGLWLCLLAAAAAWAAAVGFFAMQRRRWNGRQPGSG